jgi:hypothetical protein
LVGAATAILVAWTAAQFWLAHRAVGIENAQGRTRAAAFLAAHPGATMHVSSEPTSYWVHVGIESAVAMLMVTIVAAALALGSRQWWTLLVAALPAAVAVGHFVDGTSIGQGWNQPTDAVQTWLAVGVVVDTAVLLAVAGLLVVALPPTRSAIPTAVSTMFRVAPAAVVLAGWWLVRHPIADAAQRIWLAQAVVWALLVALVATARLPFAARLVMIVVVMPMLSFTLLDGVFGLYGDGFDAARYLHHLAVAVGVTTYVVAAPKLLRLAGLRPALSAP